MGKNKKLGRKAPETKADVNPDPNTPSPASLLMKLGKAGFVESLVNTSRETLNRYVLALTGRTPHKIRTDAQVIAALSRWADGDKNWTADEPPPKPINKITPERDAAAKKEKKPRKPGVCAFIAERVKAKDDTETIIKGIRANFPDSKATSKDVSIIRSKVNQNLM